MDTHKRKDPDIQGRKDVDVLKIAQNPLNLQTSEMLKAHVRRQGHCSEQAKGLLYPVLGRVGGLCMQPPGTELQWWRWCKKWTFRRWVQPRMLVSATPPHKETILMAQISWGWEQTRPRGHSTGGRTQGSSVTDRSWLSPTISGGPEPPPGRAMQSNAMEMGGAGSGLLSKSQVSQNPARKRALSSTSFQAPFSGLQGPQCLQLDLEESSPEQLVQHPQGHLPRSRPSVSTLTVCRYPCCL
jgi:hypothetical protein